MPKREYKRTEEQRERIGKGHLGLKRSDETKKKMRENHSHYWLGKKQSEESKRKRSESAKKTGVGKWMKGIELSKETRNKISKTLKGNPCYNNPERGRKISEAQRKEKSHFWIDGRSFLSNPYPIDWTNTLRKSIKERDHYICQLCSGEGNTIHHIDYDKKNCNPNNLITLCVGCNSKVNFNRNYWENYFWVNGRSNV